MTQISLSMIANPYFNEAKNKEQPVLASNAAPEPIPSSPIISHHVSSKVSPKDKQVKLFDIRWGLTHLSPPALPRKKPSILEDDFSTSNQSNASWKFMSISAKF